MGPSERRRRDRAYADRGCIDQRIHNPRPGPAARTGDDNRQGHDRGIERVKDQRRRPGNKPIERYAALVDSYVRDGHQSGRNR